VKTEFNDSGIVPNWPNYVKKYDPDNDKKNKCEFREAQLKADLAISVPYAVRESGSWVQYYILIGYEGGGGY